MVAKFKLHYMYIKVVCQLASFNICKVYTDGN